jgi:hypothetical protein
MTGEEFVGFHGRTELLSLASQLITVSGGPLVPGNGQRPILFVEGCGGSGRTVLLEFLSGQWSAKVPTAEVANVLALMPDDAQLGTDAVRKMLPAVLLGFSGDVPGYSMSFRRVALAWIAMEGPIAAADGEEARREMQSRLNSYRGARLNNMIGETLRLGAAAIAGSVSTVPGAPMVDIHALAAEGARVLTTRLRRSRFMARMDWGEALTWFDPNGDDQGAAIAQLVTLSGRAASPARGDQRWVDQLLMGALLADLRDSVAGIPKRPWNCLLLIDDADSPLASGFLATLADTRLEQNNLPPDPLTVIACGGELRSIGMAGTKPRRAVADLTAADFGGNAVWLRIGLPDLSPPDVANMLKEYPSLTAAYDSSLVRHVVYQLTGGHALATKLVLKKLDLDPSLFGDLDDVLSGPGPGVPGRSVEQHILERIVVSLSPRRKEIRSFWTDLAILSAAQDIDEAARLRDLLASDSDDHRKLHDEALWSFPGPAGRCAMVPVARRLLLRELARPQAQRCPAGFGRDAATDPAPTRPCEWDDVFRQLHDQASSAALPGSRDQVAARISHMLALGWPARAGRELASQLTSAATAADRGPAAIDDWLALLDSTVGTPDLLCLAHRELTELDPEKAGKLLAERVQDLAKRYPAYLPPGRTELFLSERIEELTAEHLAARQAAGRMPAQPVLGLVTEYRETADPCTAHPCTLRNRYLALRHHYDDLVNYAPAGDRLLNRAEHYRDLAREIGLPVSPGPARLARTGGNLCHIAILAG